MKKRVIFRTFTAASALLLLSLSACQTMSLGTFNNDAAQISKSLSNATMSATITTMNETDGVTPASNYDWTAVSRTTIMKGNVITISGSDLNLDAINVTIYGTEVGTYKLGLQDVAAKCGCVFMTKYNEKNATFASTSGAVTITKIDKTTRLISGTYEFNLFSGGVIKIITNGKFENLKYEVK